MAGAHPTSMYWVGVADAEEDNERVRNGVKPFGPRPPYPKYPVMYTRGYEATFSPAPQEKADKSAQ